MKNSKLAILACSAVLLAPAVSVRAEDSNKIIPGSAHEIQSSMDQEFAQEPEPETVLSELLQSSEVSLKLRNYYLNRDKPGSATDPIGWAQGGILSHKMGRLGGYFSMNTEVMGSYPIYAPDKHTGTLLVEDTGRQITTLGVVNPKLTAFGNVLSLYRQRYNLPFVNEQDNRMLPNTFEGYTIGMPAATSKSFQYIAGYIDQIKKRDSENFISMSNAAGVSSIERGMFVGGARAYFIPEWSLAAADFYVDDVVNTAYAETIYKMKFGEESDAIENTISGQYGYQSTVGDDLLTGDSFNTGFVGLQDAISYRGFVFKAALTANDDSADVRSPWGSYPGYNSVIVEDFNRAGEVAWQVGLSYDLGKLGLDGFKLAAAFIQGNQAVSESTGENIADRNETDVTLDYRVGDDYLLKGLWVRLRSATIDDDDAGTTQDFRVIVNYDIKLFGPEKKPVA